MDILNQRDARNRPLASLPDRDFELLKPHLHTIDLKKGALLTRAGEEIHAVYFPLSGVISSIVTLGDGRSIEAAMTGREGIIDIVAALGTGCSIGDSLVQGSGSAFRLDRHRLKQFLAESEAGRDMIGLSIEVLTAYSLQSLACINYHPVEARFCRWLLSTRDMLQTDELPLTQEFLAAMLGVQRSTVTVTALTLQNAGMITYRRGNIRIADCPAIEDTACECYGSIRDRVEQAFPGMYS